MTPEVRVRPLGADATGLRPLDAPLSTAAWYGDPPLPLAFPEDWTVVVHEPDLPPPLSRDEMLAALRDPIGAPPLVTVAAGARRVAIVVDDLTRPTPAEVVLPLLLDELESAGIGRERVTIVAFLAPTMIHMLLDTDPAHTVPSLRRVPYGGAPIDAGLATAAIERFGHVFVQLYGMGESPMTITYLRPQDHRGQTLSSAGIARTDVEVRLIDESGAQVEAGTEGEVCVRGDVVMSGYWKDVEATARALRGGWLHTGDVGRLEDGYLYLVARKSDVIISGGSNIYPREVEDVLHLHPAVKEACVFGVPDAKWGESVVAAVVASAPVEADALLEHCRGHIASFKKPKRIEFLDAIPKNAYGKILRRELREQFSSPAGV